MAVPKRRQSKTRRDKRRTGDKAPMPTWSTCSNCGEPQRPHHVCAKCGFYKGKEEIEVKSE
jgi:large subunit ribosomal protein L32